MMTKQRSADKTVRDIRRATRRKYSAEEKIRIVLEGLRGENSVAELCRKEGINSNVYYRWSKEFLEAGKKRLSGDEVRQATSDEVKQLRTGASASGGNNNIGIYNTYYSSPRLLEVTASASYGSAVWVGKYNAIASPFVQDSTFTGGPGLRLDVNARDARIINSMIIGGIADFAEGQQCRGVYDESLDDIDC